MKQGADNYLAKPLDFDALSAVVVRAMEKARLLQEARSLREKLRDRNAFKHIVSEDPKMRAVLDLVAQVGPSRASVLITGESGTGKELVADALRAASPRADKPFVRLNCASLAESLLESELFGHEKGAFTGAVARREGRFKQADGGTLFLDEIGEIAPGTQVKLLRFLQERTFERVGGNETLRVDVRVLAATNKDLKAEIKRGAFREDLFYRLNVISVEIPPLRERRADITALATYFLKRYADENGRRIDGFSEGALRALQARLAGGVRGRERQRAVSAPSALIEPELPVRMPDAVKAARRPCPDDDPGLERHAILTTLGPAASRAAGILDLAAEDQYKLTVLERQGRAARAERVLMMEARAMTDVVLRARLARHVRKRSPREGRGRPGARLGVAAANLQVPSAQQRGQDTTLKMLVGLVAATARPAQRRPSPRRAAGQALTSTRTSRPAAVTCGRLNGLGQAPRRAHGRRAERVGIAYAAGRRARAEHAAAHGARRRAGARPGCSSSTSHEQARPGGPGRCALIVDEAAEHRLLLEPHPVRRRSLCDRRLHLEGRGRGRRQDRSSGAGRASSSRWSGERRRGARQGGSPPLRAAPGCPRADCDTRPGRALMSALLQARASVRAEARTFEALFCARRSDAAAGRQNVTVPRRSRRGVGRRADSGTKRAGAVVGQQTCSQCAPAQAKWACATPSNPRRRAPTTRGSRAASARRVVLIGHDRVRRAISSARRAFT